jgi:formylglycine-generating enzyme required for sulfatase activity
MAATAPASGPSVKVAGGFMVPYQETIPGTKVTFQMIPVPGGTVLMGSPDTEENRTEDEGPQAQVQVEPFWMGRTEVTWAEYKKFMDMYNLFKNITGQGIRKVNASNRVDAITVPTPLYEPDHTFKFGDDESQPAVTMTQYSAKQYSKWLSGLTRRQYRIPTSAEWEHAARAGTKTAYSFGDDPAHLGEYAHFADNAPDGPGKVGTKKPNAFGIHDLHGNVWEWVVDAYTENGYADLKIPAQGLAGVIWPTLADARCVRGGGFQDLPDRLRSASRMGSVDEDWKSEDPNVPLSPWWFTTDPARMIGFRLVRSYQPLSEQDIQRFWNIDHPDIELDVDTRLQEGRGAIGLAVPELAEDIRKIQ